MPLPLFDELGHAYAYATLAELDPHFSYLASKGFTGIVWSANGRFETPANSHSTRWAGSQTIFSNVSGSSCTINPTWGNHMRSVVDLAGSYGLQVALVTRGSQAAINGSDTGNLRTGNATDFGNQLVQYFGSATNIWCWIHGWDDSRTLSEENSIWQTVTDRIRAGTGPATSKPVTYHTNPGNQFKFASAPWLDFHCIQSAHENNAQDQGWWNNVLANTTKDIFWAEPRYAHVYEDSRPPPSAQDMRDDIRLGLQYGGSRIFAVTYGDWYRVTWCSPSEGSKFNNAITTGYANGVATTRVPGPSSYGGATNVIGNNGETAYLDEMGITTPTSSHTIDLRYSTNSSLTNPSPLNGAALTTDTQYWIFADVSPTTDVTNVEFYLDDNIVNVDSTDPYQYNDGATTFTTGSYTVRADVNYTSDPSDSRSGSFTVGSPPPPGGGGDDGYFTFDGTTAKYLSTPDSIPLSVQGDLDMVFLASATTWTPTAWRMVIGKYAYSTNQASYRLGLTSFGTIRSDYTDTGTVGTPMFAEVGVPGDFTPGSVQWVRCSLRPSQGQGSIYRSSDGASWTLIADVSITTVSSIHDGNTALEIGRTGEADNAWSGDIYYVEIWDGLLDAGGTRVANPDFRTQTQATGGDWNNGGTDDHGNAWTVNGSPTYTAPVGAPTLPSLSVSINSSVSTSVDLSWSPNSVVNIDHRITPG